ncbi:MMPL family transporter [Ruthenibacterium lactatiformans]|nr:MMPL family transporter [Ruthenibacterium lactatiformans]
MYDPRAKDGYGHCASTGIGATVDYAILFTNKYLENRRENSRWHAARITVRETVVSIVTSGSILCIAGSMLGALSTNGVISQLGYLVGRGAVLSCCRGRIFLSPSRRM